MEKLELWFTLAIIAIVGITAIPVTLGALDLYNGYSQIGGIN